MAPTISEAEPYVFDNATRPDIESAERVNEAITLMRFCGPSIAANYMEVHCITPSTILRILTTKNRRK